MKIFLYIGLVWSLIAVACDPCEECGEPLLYDPLVGVVFINWDSAKTLNNLIKINSDSVQANSKQRTAFLDSIGELRDSLEVIRLLLDSGYLEYEDEEVFLDQLIADLQVEADTLESINRRISTTTRDLNSILSVINSGNMQVEQITILTNSSILTYEDSAKKYNLPLLMTANESSYKIRIGDLVDTISFSYQLENSVDDARVFRRRAKEIHLVNHTFDSLAGPKCKTDECLSNETTFTVYF